MCPEAQKKAKKRRVPTKAMLMEEVKKLREEVENLREKLQHVQADFDNYRKWVERERNTMTETAAAAIITELLPVLDNMEHVIKNTKDKGHREAVHLLHKMTLKILQNRGLKPIGRVGEKFDPYIHEAVAVVNGDEDDVVGEVVQRGYMLGSKVIRCAKVAVCRSKKAKGGD